VVAVVVLVVAVGKVVVRWLVESGQRVEDRKCLSVWDSFGGDRALRRRGNGFFGCGVVADCILCVFESFL